jgi:hypothetical protein
VIKWLPTLHMKALPRVEAAGGRRDGLANVASVVASRVVVTRWQAELWLVVHDKTAH